MEVSCQNVVCLQSHHFYKRIRMLLVHTKLVHTRMTTVELLAYDNAPECA